MSRSQLSQDPEALYSKAVKAELAKDYDSAFQHYIKSAELSIHLARGLIGDEPQKLKLKASASKCLQRAEKIKGFVEKAKVRNGIEDGNVKSLTPVGVNHYSPTEQSYVLEKGGRVNGLAIPLWSKPTKHSSSDPYEDPDGQPGLSEEQIRKSVYWKRTGEMGDYNQVLPQYIRQRVVTDCSFCASVSICVNHSLKFGSKLLESTLQRCALPSVKGSHTTFVSGRYDVKFLINGDWRRISIDDKLPYDSSTATIMCMSCNLPDSGTSVLWPSLIEKAYMKLRGGYDFPGSDSCIDIHALIGWIPEYIHIRSAEFERERTWTRLYEHFISGRCIATLGTGATKHLMKDSYELLPNHSYAVIDLREDQNGERDIAILDSWMGKGSQTPEILHVPYDDVLSYFDGIYISWDPGNWRRNLNLHAIWRMNDTSRCTNTSRLKWSRNDANDQQIEVWVLLSRHTSHGAAFSDYASLKTKVHEQISELGVNSVDYKRDQDVYTNNPHILRKVTIPSTLLNGFISIFASYEGAVDSAFTLTVLATDLQMSWDEGISRPPYCKTIEGSFTAQNSGGNPNNPTFMNNPQYHLRINPSVSASLSDIRMEVQADKNMPVNVSIVRSSGERVTELPQQGVVASSGPYSYGFAALSKQVQGGSYTIVVSTFDVAQVGPFTLRVESSYPPDLTSIPQEGAGLYTRVIKGSWTKETAGGSPSSDDYRKNPVFVLDVPVRSKFIIRLQLLQPNAMTAINATLYPLPATDGLAKHISTSGGYDRSVCGVIQETLLPAGKYWIIPSTYNPGVVADFKIIVHSPASGFALSEKTYDTAG